MKRLRMPMQVKRVHATVVLMLALGVICPSTGWACAACMGNPDSALTQGLNWGIASLLAIVMIVLTGAAAFFVTLSRRAARWEQRQNLSESKPLDAAVPQTAGTIQ